MSEHPSPVLAYFDVVLLVVAAPIMLLIGVPAVGYLVGAGAWIGLRALGIGVEHWADGARDANQATAVRLGFMLGRLFALAIAVILVRNATTQDDGLTCLLVIVFAFTVALAASALATITRRPAPRQPRSR